MYESPIKLHVANIYNQIVEQQENEVYKAVLHYVPDIDKAELIRALQYDREQYQKGYADGQRDAEAKVVRCADCKHWDNDSDLPGCTNEFNGLVCGRADDFCSYGERKDGDGNGN